MAGEVGASISRILNKLQYALANNNSETSNSGPLAATDRIPVADASADYAVKYATPADVLAAPSAVEVVVTTNVIAASESGTTFFLDLAGGFTSTLPAPAAGLRFKFIVKTAPTTAYIIATNGGANIMVVSVNELETDTTEDGPSDDDADTINFVANTALPGDFLDVFCDGTKWYCLGQVRADGAITTSTT
jgi:hypothetical protein